MEVVWKILVETEVSLEQERGWDDFNPQNWPVQQWNLQINVIHVYKCLQNQGPILKHAVWFQFSEINGGNWKHMVLMQA